MLLCVTLTCMRWHPYGEPSHASSCTESEHVVQFLVRETPGEAGGQELAGVDWVFNAWGGESGGLYQSWDLDDKAKPCSALWHGH